MQLRAFIELFIASIIWGFGFTASIWALNSIDPISMSVVRFAVAFVAGLIFYGLFRLATHQKEKINHRSHLYYSILPGFFLAMTIGLQTWGLELTSATNSGFITTLYVVLVPLIQKFFFKRKIQRLHFLWVFIALLGTALMIQFHLSSFNNGDILTFVCAIFAAFHIIWIGRVQVHIQSAFLFNCYQSLWAAFGSLLLWPTYGSLYLKPFGTLSIIGLLAVTFGSTLLAFALQVRAQKVLTPSVSSMIYLLESPFAALFAVILLNEVISPLQLVGGVLIFFSAVGATITEQAKASLRKADQWA